jgi:hypothetical protein
LKGRHAQVRFTVKDEQRPSHVVGLVGRSDWQELCEDFGIEEKVFFSATLSEAPGFHVYSGRLSPHPLEVVPSKDDSAHFAKKRLGEPRPSPGEDR